MNRNHFFTLIVFSAAASLFAADPKPDRPVIPTYLTEAEARQAGPDFDLQGEYANAELGVQVVALGNDLFRAVFYHGGLPGAGWDKSARIEVEAKREGNAVRFAQDNWSATLTKDGLRGEGQHGDFSLKKVHRQSPTLGAKPPPGALVLFDGSSVEAWRDGHLDEQGRKLLAAGTKTKRDDFQNFTLHVEFLLPFKPAARNQDRGNSGIYLQDRYEIQVLDSFGLKGESNECGGLYRSVAPLLNMAFPPLTWQTYDIDFTAAEFDASGKKTKNAIVTVRHNGVLIHDYLEIPGKTGAGKPETSSFGPIQLQGHGNPVFYRNIWVVTK